MSLEAGNTILILTPRGPEALGWSAVLEREGMVARICPGIGDCVAQIKAGAGALLVSEESLASPEASLLVEALKSQLAWSELPLVLLLRSGEDTPGSLVDQVVSAAGSVALLEGPVSDRTLVRSAQLALRSRERQRQVRDLLRERAQQQREQLQAAERLRLQTELIDRISDAVVEADPEFRIRSWNLAAERMYGWKAGEVLGHAAGDLFRTEFQGTTREGTLRELISKGSLIIDTIHYDKTGRPLHIQSSIRTLSDAAGRLTGFVSVMRDMTGRRQAEEALRQSTERLQLAATAARLFSFEWDPITDLVRRDGDASAVLGVPFREETGGSYFARVHPEDRPRFTELVRSLRPGTDTYATTYRVLRPEGGESVLEESGRALFDEAGRFVRLIGMTADVTAREQAQQRLRQSEAFNRHIADIAPCILYVYDLEERRNIWGNRELSVILGYTREQIDAMAGSLLEKLLHPDDLPHYVEHLSRLIELPEGTIADFEFRIRHADGSWRWLHSRETVFLRSAEGRPRQIIGAAVDVSELKLAQERLTRNHETFRNLIENHPMGIYVVDADLRLCHASRGAQHTFRHVRPLLGTELGQALRTLWPEPFASEAMGRFRHTLETGEPYVARDTVERRQDSGEVEAYDWRIERILLPDGRHGVVCYYYDLTEQRRLEGDLREREARFRAMFDQHKAAKLVIEPHTGAIVDANAAAVEFYGYPREQLCALRIDQINQLPPEEVAAERRRALAEQRRYFEFPHRLASGEVRWVQVYSTPVPVQGRLLLYSIIHDITDRKQAELALREAHDRLRMAKSAAQLGIHDYSLNTGVIAWDERVRELWGVGPDAPIDYDLFLSRIHPEDRAATQAAVNRALDPSGDGQYSAEFRVVHSDRTTWIAATGQATFENARPARLVGTVQDITARRAFQAELERLVTERTARLRELVSELEHFSYTITHDMRAPLRAMQGFAELFAETCGPALQEDAGRFLQRIRTAANRMDALITDALSYSEAVRKHLPIAPVNPGVLLRGMLDTYPELQARHARIQVQPDMPLIYANEAGLTQVFSNLLNNAIKFAKPGHLAEIRVWAEITTRRPETPANPLADPEPVRSAGFAPIPSLPVPASRPNKRWVRIWVEDQGIGISASMLPRIFNMFARGNTEQAGTGIGLALVRKVVDRMGGQAGVESEEGRGSRFWVEFLPAD